jgi:hypothetical protein
MKHRTPMNVRSRTRVLFSRSRMILSIRAALWTFTHARSAYSNMVRGQVRISLLFEPKERSLSGGGVSSGLMSFLPIGDKSAGSIASGGVTRRAAKMVIVDADHPEICEFIDWKVWEEYKAACMYIGSKAVLAQSMMGQCGYEIPTALKDRLSVGYPAQILDVDWEGIALGSVSGQNSNNSVRVSVISSWTLADNHNSIWNLTARTTGKTVGRLVHKNCGRRFVLLRGLVLTLGCCLLIQSIVGTLVLMMGKSVLVIHAANTSSSTILLAILLRSTLLAFFALTAVWIWTVLFML